MSTPKHGVGAPSIFRAFKTIAETSFHAKKQNAKITNSEVKWNHLEKNKKPASWDSPKQQAHCPNKRAKRLPGFSLKKQSFLCQEEQSQLGEFLSQPSKPSSKKTGAQISHGRSRILRQRKPVVYLSGAQAEQAETSICLRR